ncbi:MAG: gliding motility-associated C-terminal domain-containing protein, partial [Saprospiraceae bacterium]
CDSIISIDLDFADPKIKVQQVFTVNLGATVQITATPDFIPFQIKWEPSTNLSCSDCLNPISSPTEDIEYTLTLTDSNGCEVISRIKILVIKDINIYVPNVFSPNNDNLNDRFEIIANSTDLIINNYNIYDRWGELVYSISNTPLVNFKAWDGRFNSEYVNPGVYTYYIKISTKAGFEKTIQGDVTLLR